MSESVLEQAWWAGVSAVRGEHAVRQAALEAKLRGPLKVAAVGKAAPSMLLGLFGAGVAVEQALVISKDGHSDARLAAYPQVRQREAAHPVPDQRSLAAGAELRQFVAACGAQDQLLLLVSGGASALAEHLIDGEDLGSLQRKTQSLLAAGADIAQINATRQRLSMLKAGGLCADCAAPVQSWLLSDVEGDSPAVIGSGIGLLAQPEAHRIVASNAIARHAAAQQLAQHGLPIALNQESLYDDLNAVADSVCEALKNGPPGAYVFGGEPTVVLPPKPGEGGRNQALALALSIRLAGTGIHGLVAGTDGTDGPTQAAGGWFGRREPDPALAQSALERADAGSYLRQTQQLFSSGPTGTNVMDLLVALKAD